MGNHHVRGGTHVYGWREALQEYWEIKNQACFDEKRLRELRKLIHPEGAVVQEMEAGRLLRIQESCERRNVKPIKQECRVRILQARLGEEEAEVLLSVHERQAVRDRKMQMHLEEEQRFHRVRLKQARSRWRVVEDVWLTHADEWDTRNDGQSGTLEGVSQDIRSLFQRGGRYRRDLAVRYAESWWNGHNPQYRAFDVDCTNYVSQCLRAGGAPMTHVGQRGKGWWYQGNGGTKDNWSYSWAVAHSLRWYLATSKSGLRALEKSAASQLELGDVICYDFDGDGRWQHNAIVTAFDHRGEPLVNAHTNNVRHKFWDYRHSYAWTEQIQYKFFHIVDQF
ncbi:MAG: hypothetical protein BAA01_00430 [Bacillus thermozeamaize]|uniref:Putative amidase domain-containing protein n=1 Tax=Bacillus thermozeamaize TaxID=230954 RepID=A0A1Y3PUA6_9BACI|nr:MAG: hypothetical protein BAA01_00430 [Bacillus thermozeamaize]